MPDPKTKPEPSPAGCDTIAAGRECHDSHSTPGGRLCQIQNNCLAGIFGHLKEIVVIHEMIFNEAGEAVDYRITDFNTAFLQILGKTGEEVRGMLATGLFAARPAPYIREYESALPQGSPENC